MSRKYDIDDYVDEEDLNKCPFCGRSGMYCNEEGRELGNNTDDGDDDGEELVSDQVTCRDGDCMPSGSWLPYNIWQEQDPKDWAAVEAVCDDCDRRDCDDCDRGDCDNCDYRDCNDCDRGNCKECSIDGIIERTYTALTGAVLITIENGHFVQKSTTELTSVMKEVIQDIEDNNDDMANLIKGE